MRSDLPVVLFSQQVTDSTCGANNSVVDFADPGRAHIGVADQSQPLVLARELGHLLGILNHDASQPNLMNPQVTQMTSFISPAMCTTARAAAAQYVLRKWGVTVDPGQWTVTPPFQR